MTAPLVPATIMFLFTTGFSALLLFPAIRFSQGDKIVRFYWVGFWAFLGAIASLSGAQAVLVIMQVDVESAGRSILMGVTAAFVLFVMFAWCRLSLKGATALLRKTRD